MDRFIAPFNSIDVACAVLHKHMQPYMHASMTFCYMLMLTTSVICVCSLHQGMHDSQTLSSYTVGRRALFQVLMPDTL